MKINFDSYPHNYEVEFDQETSGRQSEKVFYYPGASEASGRNGALLKIIPQNQSAWFGVFSGTSQDVQVFSTPDSDIICIVCGGYVYVGNVNDPKSIQMIGSQIAQVVNDAEHNIFLLVGFQYIEAWRLEEKLWRSDRPVIDGIHVNKTDSEFVYADYFDPTRSGDNKWLPMKLDIRTGKIVEPSKVGREQWTTVEEKIKEIISYNKKQYKRFWLIVNVLAVVCILGIAILTPTSYQHKLAIGAGLIIIFYTLNYIFIFKMLAARFIKPHPHTANLKQYMATFHKSRMEPKRIHSQRKDEQK